MHGSSEAGGDRHVRSAQLPSDPEGEVPPSGPVGARRPMLTELHVADLGIVADLTLVVGPGLAAITGATGAGKPLLGEALELLVGGRADATLIRDGASEARVEGRFVDPESGV